MTKVEARVDVMHGLSLGCSPDVVDVDALGEGAQCIRLQSVDPPCDSECRRFVPRLSCERESETESSYFGRPNI
jgi:hypothetical protein